VGEEAARCWQEVLSQHHQPPVDSIEYTAYENNNTGDCIDTHEMKHPYCRFIGALLDPVATRSPIVADSIWRNKIKEIELI
jgi:hypothetical protein